MSRALEDYRSVQIDIRLLTETIGKLNDEEKTHPGKSLSNDSLEKQQAWLKIKNGYTKRRESLKKQLNAKQEQRDMLYLNLLQTPLPMHSYADLIDKLTSIEGQFATDGADAAWDAISGVIDNLERDSERIAKLQSVGAS